jgi:hypothetical protein
MIVQRLNVIEQGGTMSYACLCGEDFGKYEGNVSVLTIFMPCSEVMYIIPHSQAVYTAAQLLVT